MIDFTVHIYEKLLAKLKESDYTPVGFKTFLESPPPRCVVLRHDVDLKPRHSLKFAQIEHQAGARGVYYFRAVPQSWDEGVIRKIAGLGHEIGYHYEDLTTCKGNMELAYRNFRKNLEALRAISPVSTICMHGSPRSPYDSRALWDKHDYRDEDIIGEPYIDVDFSTVLYLSDTGRRWDGHRVSVRDRTERSLHNKLEKEGHVIRKTGDLLDALDKGVLPAQMMLTLHPQRWNNRALPWLSELLWQNAKNLVKGAIVRSQG